jgi:hypothetical protein
LPFAAIVPIYVLCAQDLKHGAQLTANNCTRSAQPFAKHATQNVQNTPGTWNVAKFARKPVKIVLLAVKKYVRLTSRATFIPVKQYGVLHIDKALPVL